MTTAPSAAFVVVTVKTIPSGAVPSSRVLWKNADQPEDPLAPGNTRIFPVKQTPCRACRASTIVPVAGSMPPQPEMVSGDTSASPVTTPGTTVRPRRTVPTVAVIAAHPTSGR